MRRDLVGRVALVGALVSITRASPGAADEPTSLSATPEGVRVGDQSPASPPAPPAPLAPPRLLHFVEAPYPEAERAQGREATVILELDVSAAGAVTAVRLVEGAGPAFDEAALRAARGLLFDPARRGDQPVASRITFRYRFALRPVNAPAAPPVAGPTPGLRGTVVGPGETPVEGATLRLAEARSAGAPEEPAHHRTVAGAGGEFDFSDVPPGAYRLEVAAAGFRPEGVAVTLLPDRPTEVVVRLRPERGRYETIVRGRVFEEVTRHTLEREEFLRVAGTSGDALRVIENLPGVARPPGGAGILIVRGAEPNNTRVLINGESVPLLYHFGGLTSIVNADLLDRIDFYPGNFSARFGNATAGVVDVQMRSPAGDRLRGYADVSLIDAHALAEGPVGENASVAFAVRRSYIDALLELVAPAIPGLRFTAAPVYWDYQAMATWRPTPRDELRLVWFGSDDRLALVLESPAAQDPAVRGALETETALHRVQFHWRRQLRDGAQIWAMLAPGYTGIDFSLADEFFFHTKIFLTTGQEEILLPIARGVQLVAGWYARAGGYEVAARGPTFPREGETPGPIGTQTIFEQHSGGQVLEPALYAEAILEPVRGLRIVPGLRLELYIPGDKVVLDPRLGVRWAFARDWTAKGGLGIFSRRADFNETDPVFGNPNLDPERAIHAAVGVERAITRDFDVSLEGFWKYLYDLVTRRPTARGFSWSNEGIGYAYGLELLVRHRPTRRLYGWIAYTLMRSERRDHPGENWRLFDFDQTHIFTLVAGVHLGRGWDLSARFRYVTGNPDTPILRAVYDADADVYSPIPGAVNSVRLADFHQLDLRLDKTWRLSSRLQLRVYLDVQNVYNHQNVETTIYNYDYSQSAALTGLPILPSLGVRLIL